MSDDRHRLDTFRARIEALRLVPLWERLGELLPPAPRVRSVPYHWPYDSLRPILLEAAGLISEQEAERRVLILENPGLPGESAATETLFAGLQLIMPGEIAPSHRHTPGALRLILESDHAFTSVDGEPQSMERGDVILTPGWQWHDHEHRGSRPAIWLDVLDLPVVRALGPRFAERHPELRPPQSAPAGLSFSRYGRNMRPLPADQIGWRSPLRYGYCESRSALHHLSRNSARDNCHGFKMEYVNPTNGSAALPTISAFLQLLPEGFEGEAYRSSDGGVYCVVEGRGSVTIGDGADRVRFDYRPNDLFSIPCWAPYSFAARDESIIFSATDRIIQTTLGIWRERREADFA